VDAPGGGELCEVGQHTIPSHDPPSSGFAIDEEKSKNCGAKRIEKNVLHAEGRPNRSELENRITPFSSTGKNLCNKMVPGKTYQAIDKLKKCIDKKYFTGRLSHSNRLNMQMIMIHGRGADASDIMGFISNTSILINLYYLLHRQPLTCILIVFAATAQQMNHGVFCH
jgi:hypothetical protein